MSKSAARQAAVDLLRIVADHGTEDTGAADKAYRAGIRVFGQWASGEDRQASTDDVVARLDEALDILAKLNGAGRQSLVEAVTRTVAHDGRLVLREAELLRAICASLDCPLPPILPAL